MVQLVQIADALGAVNWHCLVQFGTLGLGAVVAVKYCSWCTFSTVVAVQMVIALGTMHWYCRYILVH